MRNTIYSSAPYKLLTALVIAAMVLAALPVRPAFAATISVSTTTDEFTSSPTSVCSLREAIVLANNNGISANDCTRGGEGDDDTITLLSGETYVLSLTTGANSGDLDIGNAEGTSGNLIIQASGSTPAIINANDIDRVLDAGSATTSYNLTLINIIVTNGNTTGTGGGIRFDGTGTLTLTNSAVTSNVAASAAGCGGGIYNNSAATVVIANSTIDGNTCATTGADGGGLFKNGGGTLDITNSTFSNNSTADNGGGAQFGAGTVTVSNSTFASNIAGNKGGGIQAGGATVSIEFTTFSDNIANDIAASGNAGGAVQASNGSVAVSTSILANSTGMDCDKSGAIASVVLTNSLAENKGDCSGTPTSTSDPGLGPLGDNGGLTNTMAILTSSPANNQALSCGSFTTDQRGSTRPQDGFCDLGSYEVQNPVAPTVFNVTHADSDPTNASNVDFTVTFSESVTGVDATDFTLTETVSGSPSVTNVSGSGAVYTVTVSTGTGNGTIRLDVVDDDSIVDVDTNTLDGGFTNGEVYTIDKESPTVSSITRADANPTNAANVDFGVAFSESVSGVDVTDFDLTTTGGIIGASITDVNGVGETYTVTVNTGSGNGTIRLDIVDNDSIVDGANNPLGGVGAGNGDFTTGEVYDVDKTISTTLNSISSQDGWILESSETSGVGGTMNNIATTFNLGDNATDKQYRSILSFSTSSLPDNAVITKVTLKVKKHSIVGGGNPVSLFQGFKVDIKTGLFGIGALELGDFKATASKTYGPFSPPLSSGWYSLNLTNGQAYINKVGHTQLRLRFHLDDNNNNLANFLKLYSGNATVVSDRPQLIIEYYVP